MTLNQPDKTLRQSMHRLLDRFDYLNEDDADYNVNLDEDSGYVRLYGIKDQDDVDDCRSVMPDGLDEITLNVEVQDDGKYVVTANYNELPY